MEQNYLIIENNVVTNIVVWDGNTQTWTPPEGSIQLICAITPALVWEPVFVEEKLTDYVLKEEIGLGSTGFTWNGSVLMTDEPKPIIEPPQIN